MENDHSDPRAITTATLCAAADHARTDVAHVVANMVLGLSHYDANFVPDQVVDLSGSTAKGIETIEDFLTAAWYDPLTKEEGVVEGQVLKAEEEDHFLLMVAYSPNRMPLRGADKMVDLASERVLEKACWSFMAKGAKTGMWHQEGHGDEAVCVENGMYRNSIPWDVHGDGSLLVKKGDWLVGFLLSDYAWGLYKSGQIGGVSMQGGARRQPASADALARVRSGA